MCAGARYLAVLFDAGQTLVRVEPSVGTIYANTAERYGVHVAPVDAERAFRAVWDERRLETPLRTSEALERQWWFELVDAVFSRVGQRAAFGARFEDFFAELYEWFARPEAWHVFSDARPALDALRGERVRCAVVSNWDSRLPLLLGRLGLTEYFEFVLTSAEAGWRKPHPGIFERACALLNLPPERVVYIGDSKVDDFDGARDARLTPLLLDRSAASSDGDCLNALTELPRWLKRSAPCVS